MEESRTDSGGMEVNFRALFRQLLRRFPVILLAAVCGTVILYAYGKARASSSYTSRASLYVLAKRIEVTHTSDTRIIHIAVTDDNPVQAQQIAEAVVNASVLQIRSLTGCADVRVMDKASEPAIATGTSVRKKAAVGGIAGAVLAIFVVLIRFLSDDTLHAGSDIEKYLAIPSFGQIPLAGTQKGKQKRNPSGTEKENGMLKEAFRTIRANLRFTSPEAHVVACAAATHGKGTSETARRLAEALASSGLKTLLVDTNLRGARFGPDTAQPDTVSAYGLSDVLLKRCSAEQAVQAQGAERRFFLRAGSAGEEGAERVRSARVQRSVPSKKSGEWAGA